MARLVVKRTPWWKAHKKWAMVVLPLATLQAATLVGFGYFYHRLDSLEHQAESPAASTPSAPPPVPVKPLASTERDVPEPSKEQALHAETIVLKTGVLMQEAEVKVASIQPPESKAAVVGGKEMPKLPPATKLVEKAEKRQVVKHSPEKKAADLTAVANRSSLQRSKPVKPTLPVKQGVWVYLGELRDYGWYGQMLHIPPTSRLPTPGRSYQTQYIQRVYTAPYGKLIQGKFHLGEWVYLHEVVQGRRNDVWGRVSPR